MFKRNYYRLASWIAIAAVLFAALAPTISYAFPASSQPQTLWQELCTAQSTKLVPGLIAGDTQQKPASGGMVMHFEHCPYCFSHAGSIAMLFDSNPAVMRLNTSFSLPQLFYQSPYPLFAWVKSSPRAPPSIS